MENWFFKNRKRLIGLGIFFCLFFVSQVASAATYYWVGTAGGNTSLKTNWHTSAKACDGAGNASAAPVAADTIYFVSNCVNDAVINTTLNVATTSIAFDYTGIITQAGGVTFTSAVYDQAGGSFSGGNSSISIGTFILSGGVATSTSGIMTVTGNFTVSGSPIFNHNGGGLVIDSSYKNSTITMGGVTFNNLTFSSGESLPPNYTSYLVDNFSVNGNFTVARPFGYGGYLHSWIANSPIVIILNGNFFMTTGQYNSFGNSNITINMNGGNKTFSTVTGCTFYANINFNGAGTTTINKIGNTGTSFSTTTVNGIVALSGSSVFDNLVINSGKVLDVSNDGINSYNLTINRNFINNAGANGLTVRNGTVTIDHTDRTGTITTGGLIFNNLTFYMGTWTTSSITLADSFTVNGAFSVSTWVGGSPTLTISGSSAVIITALGNVSINNTPQLTFGNNITINMNGADKTFTVANVIFRANVNFNGEGTTTVNAKGTWSAGLTTINGIVALSGSSVFNNLVINSGKVLDVSNDGINSYSLTINGYLTNNAGANGLTVRNGTVTIDHTDRTGTITTGGLIFNNLTFYMGTWTTSSITLADSFTVNGAFSVSTWVGGSPTLTISGSSAVIITALGNVSINNTPQLTFGNNITINMNGADKTFTVANVIFRANVNFNGEGTTTVNAKGTWSAGLTSVNQSATLSTTSIFYNLTINSGSTFNTSGYGLTVNGNFNINNNGTFALIGTETLSKCPTSAAGGIVSYMGTSTSTTTPYTIKNCTYSVLAINGAASSTFALPANLIVATTTINTGTLSLAGKNFTTTNLVNNGTLRLQGAESVSITNFDIDSGIVEYVGDGDAPHADNYTLKPFNYYNLYINSIDSMDTYSAASVTHVYNNLIVNNGTLLNYSGVIVDGQFIIMNELVPPTVSTPITILPGAVSGNYFSGTISLRSSISDTGSLLKLNSCKVSFNGGVWINTGVTQDALYCHYNDITPNASFSLAFGVSDNANNFGTSTTVNFIYNGVVDASSTLGFGGIVGYQDNGSISNSYANGSVTGTKDAGGLVGYQNGGSISDSYSIATISGTTFPGGLVGWQNAGTVTNSFWDTLASGIADSFVGDGRTTSDMKNENTFSSWSTSIWNIVSGSYPVLR